VGLWIQADGVSDPGGWVGVYDNGGRCYGFCASADLELLRINLQADIDIYWALDYRRALIPLPWSEYGIPKENKLRVGIMWNDGALNPHPSIVRALNMVKEKLEFWST
jgi:hypothetical protein